METREWNRDALLIIRRMKTIDSTNGGQWHS